MAAPFFSRETERGVQAFRVGSQSVEEFVARVQAEIRARDFQDIATIRVSGDVLEVRFSWMGTSVLSYRLQCRETGFDASPLKQSMSPFHAPFRAGFEEKLDAILARVGAESL